MSKCSAKNRRCAGGDEWCIGGTLRIENGATLDVAEGAEIKGLSTGGGGGGAIPVVVVESEDEETYTSKTTLEQVLNYIKTSGVIIMIRYMIPGLIADTEYHCFLAEKIYTMRHNGVDFIQFGFTGLYDEYTTIEWEPHGFSLVS